MSLVDKSVNVIEDLVIALDGSTYTYDPWMEMIGSRTFQKSHLLFQWSCLY